MALNQNYPKVEFNSLLVPSDSFELKSVEKLSHPIAREPFVQTKACFAPFIDNVPTEF